MDHVHFRSDKETLMLSLHTGTKTVGQLNGLIELKPLLARLKSACKRTEYI